MPQNAAATEFLRTRRSHPPKTLTGPAPDQAELTDILTLAARVPDHGKIEPWRFVVLERATLDRLAPILAQFVLSNGGTQADADKAASAFASPVIVGVVSAPIEHKVPVWEQNLSAGAVCLSLVNAALAAGYGASWLSGPATKDAFAQQHLGLAEDERLVGLIHIGTPGATPVPDRPRPDISAKTTFLP